ncbi:EamA-like transporter family protein [methanogenic archaeon mixed culture ISO4-G1]|nr:EamA-like transporter family protein [methanogenic archaeon mixed culture ISO4-G1]
MGTMGSSIGAIAAVLSGVVWGFLGVFSREFAAIGLDSVQVTCLRFLFLTLAVFPYMFLFRRDELRIDRKSLVILILMGTLGFGLSSIFYVASANLVSLGLISVLANSAPFFVILFSVPLLGEDITRYKIVAVIVAFFGCVLCTGVLTDPGDMNVLGVLMGLGSGFVYSFYTMGSKVVSSRGVSVMGILFYVSLFAFIFTLPMCDPIDAINVMATDGYALVLMLLFALGMTMTQMFLYSFSIARIGAGKVSILVYSETICATMIGLLWYGEMLTFEIVAGIVLTMVGLVIIYLDKQNDAVAGPEGPDSG